MRSKVAEQSQRDLLDAARRMTPEQRLNAFLAHCEAMAHLKAAGEQMRREAQTRR